MFSFLFSSLGCFVCCHLFPSTIFASIIFCSAFEVDRVIRVRVPSSWVRFLSSVGYIPRLAALHSDIFPLNTI